MHRTVFYNYNGGSNWFRNNLGNASNYIDEYFFMKKKRAFTLIEILIVIILITILASLTQPKLSKIYNSLKIESQINEIIDMVKLSIELSEIKQEKITLSIDDEINEMLILDKNLNLIKKINYTLNLSYDEAETIFDKGHITNENKLIIETFDFERVINITNENIKTL